MTSTGAPIEILASIVVENNSTSPGDAILTITRGTTELVYGFRNKFNAGQTQVRQCLAISDTPGVGTYTYYLYVDRATTLGNINVSHRYLRVLETKK